MKQFNPGLKLHPRTFPNPNYFLMVYNFVDIHSVYLLVLNVYRLKYHLKNFFTLYRSEYIKTKLYTIEKQFDSASQRRNLKFDSFTGFKVNLFLVMQQFQYK